MHRGVGLTAIAGLAVLAAMGSGPSQIVRFPGRTLEEEEEQAVLRMKRYARRKRIRDAEEAARLAEENRPKSRQERRAAERKKAKRIRPDRNYQKGERRR